MPITRTALRQLRPILPRPSCGGMLTRQLHATARRPHSTWPAQHATELPANKVYRDFFPCTLHYYSCHGPTMAMHATSSSPSSDDDTVDNRLGQDVVRVQEDGLIYPGPEGTDSVWNGAILMPLATFLLDITENYHDVYEEQKAAGHDLPEPYFLTVPKGLRIPSTLLLDHKHGGMFYLMPRVGLSLSGLNRELNDLFSSSSCSKLPFREWFKKYNFLEVYNNPGEDAWMSK
ncbi:hypothetical protein FJTKL_13259 [Diaporthe vaccinii]|uniref:Tse2 ADP-ribosyltransferase toxin domain-containing protein n=1 Tax=Diaporthe vaccinii TaxID=105482 RepID=A0ABR4EBE5_9PEZI